MKLYSAQNRPKKKLSNEALLEKLKMVYNKTVKIYQRVVDSKSSTRNRNKQKKGLRPFNRASESFITEETKKHCGTLKIPSETKPQSERVEEEQFIPGIWSGAEAKTKEIPWQVINLMMN